jgi:hypothetical protein
VTTVRPFIQKGRKKRTDPYIQDISKRNNTLKTHRNGFTHARQMERNSHMQGRSKEIRTCKADGKKFTHARQMERNSHMQGRWKNTNLKHMSRQDKDNIYSRIKQILMPRSLIKRCCKINKNKYPGRMMSKVYIQNEKTG